MKIGRLMELARAGQLGEPDEIEAMASALLNQVDHAAKYRDMVAQMDDAGRVPDMQKVCDDIFRKATKQKV